MLLEGIARFGPLLLAYQGLTEQELLKMAVAFPLIAWGALADFPRVAESLPFLNRHDWSEAKKRGLRMHPEMGLLILNLRNPVIAHKEVWLANHLHGHHHFTTVIGPDHILIEDDIVSSPQESLSNRTYALEQSYSMARVSALIFNRYNAY